MGATVVTNGETEFLDFCTANRLRVRFVEPRFLRGDSNDDGAFNIADTVHKLNYLFDFTNPPSLGCAASADSNDDGAINISDPIYELAYLLLAGAGPPTPFLGCGTDPTPDDLGCIAHRSCR